MRKNPNEKMIGLFLLIGLIAFFGIAGKFMADKIISQDDEQVVMYFDESVKGLSVGSPVVFKGVEIGKVSKIELRAALDNMDFSIPVYARMLPNQDINPWYKSYEFRKKSLDHFIEKGLRARLATQSYLTGQLMVELEIIPKAPIVLRHKKQGNVLEIPTVLSPIGELSKDVKNLPLKQITERINTILGDLERQLPQILPHFAAMSQKMDRLVSKNGPALTDVLTNLNKTLYDISNAAKSFKNVADYLERHPESLIRGKKGY